MRHALFTTLFIAMTRIANADPSACLAAPTQGCLFDLAFEQAEAEESIARRAQSFFMIAILQESVGLDGYADTMARLPAALADAEAEPIRNGNDLAWALILLQVCADKLALAPQTEQLIHDFVRPRITLSGGNQSVGRTLTYVAALRGDTDEIAAQITSAQPEDRHSVARAAARGYISLGDFQSAFDLLIQVPTTAFETELNRLITDHLILEGELATAEEMALLFEDAQDRRLYLAQTALAHAKAGDFSAALRLRYNPMLGELSTADWPLVMALAEVHARAGQEVQTAEILALLNLPFGSNSTSDRLYVTAALVSGNFAHLQRLMETAEHIDGKGYFLLDPINAFRVAGHTDFDPFLDVLSPSQLVEALHAIGHDQVQMGDTDAALATLARIRALPAVPDQHFDMRGFLARLLADEGRISEAANLVQEYGYAVLTADVATGIE